MADQRVVQFIQEALKKGNSRPQIEQVLLQKGWKQDQVQDAFHTASSPLGNGRGFSGEKKPLLKNPLFLILLGLIGLLILTGVAYLLLAGGECSVDSDCDSGYACDDGICIFESGCSSDDDCGREEECYRGDCVALEEDVIEIEKAECSFDSECLGGFACSVTGNCYDVCLSDTDCASGYTCELSVCEEESDGSSSGVEEGEENYLVLESFFYDADAASNSTTYQVNISHEGDMSSNTNPYLLCELNYSDGSLAASSVESTSSLDLDESYYETCVLSSSQLYLDALSSSAVNLIFTARIDSTDLVAETNESDNSLRMEFALALEDFDVTGSTVCTGSSSCSGYDCAVNGYCFDSCTSYGSECAEGYACTSGVCTAETTAGTLGLGDVCTADSACSASYYCSDTYHICTECESDSDCSDGFACDASDAANGGSCSRSCVDDSACASGYSCDTSSSSGTYQECIECSADSDCDTTDYCTSAGACKTRLGLDCSLDDNVCDPYLCGEGDVCVECDSGDVSTCGGYDCDSSSDTCYSSCSGDSECASGYSCSSSGDCVVEVVCSDSIPSCGDDADNDGDGLSDLDDPSCGTWDDDESALTLACSDTDEGYDLYEQGEITGIFYSDGSTVIGLEDYCSGEQLFEYWCPDDGEAYDGYAYGEVVDCASDEVCDSGVCVELASLEKCAGTNSDGNEPLTVGSELSDIIVLDDECWDGSYLLEAFCTEDANYIEREAYLCQGGCLDSSYLGDYDYYYCSSDGGYSTLYCAVETDGGNDPFTLGYVGDHDGITLDDVCYDEKSLLESYCGKEGAGLYQSVYECFYGCADGVCLTEDLPACSNGIDDDGDGLIDNDDDGCTSASDDTERLISIGETKAPEKEGFLDRMISFFFFSEAAEEKLLEQSYVEKA